MTIHNQLSRYHSKINKTIIHPFLFGIFTLNTNKSKATHSYDFRFTTINTSNLIVPIELIITNLIHSSQVEYSQFHGVSGPLQTLSNQLMTIANSTPNVVNGLEQYCINLLKQLQASADRTHQSTVEKLKLQEQIALLQRELQQSL